MNEEEIVEKYRGLIRSYVDGKISAAEFSQSIINEFKNEDPGLSDETFSSLQSLFGAADAYCEDPDLRGDWEIDEDQLMDEIREIEDQLESRLETIRGDD